MAERATVFVLDESSLIVTNESAGVIDLANVSRTPFSSLMYSLWYWITVSTIETGAGSSGLSTRPILPTASSTSGTLMIRRSSSFRMSVASPIEA